MNLRFGLGGLTAQAMTHDAEGYHSALHEAIEFGVNAERLGFDGVWVSEHHFVSDGYLPSPLVLLAALSQRTERVQLGTQVMLAPLYNSVKLAEDAAVLDQLSGGRLVLGLGLGYHDREYAAFGTTRSKRIERLLECVNALRSSARGEALPIGDSFPEGVEVRPLPYQPDGVPVWIGAMAEAGVRRAARVGNGYVAPMMNPQGFARRLSWLEDEGVDSSFAAGVYVHAFVADHDAWPKAQPGIAYVEQQYGQWQSTHSDFDKLKTVDRSDLSVPPSHVIVGTPEQVAERLEPFCALLRSFPGEGDRQVIVRLSYPGIERGAIDDSMALFAEEVIPLLQR